MGRLTQYFFIILLTLTFSATYAGHRKDGKIIVQFHGTDIGEERLIDDGVGGVLPALCFDVDMRDLSTGKKVGTGIDCLSEVTDVSGGISLLATSIFEFKNGTIVNRGYTSVQPKTVGSPDITHITGSIPTSTDSTLIASLGKGKYAGKTGQTRLSGAVAMKALGDGRLQITFDCIFVVTLDD